MNGIIFRAQGSTFDKSVRAFQPPASVMQALRQTPPEPLKLKKLPVAKRTYCSHLMWALRQISWERQTDLTLHASQISASYAKSSPGSDRREIRLH